MHAEFRRRIAELEATRDNWQNTFARENEECLAKMRTAVAKAAVSFPAKEGTQS